MDPIFPQPTPILPAVPLPITMAPASAISALWQEDRIARLTVLAPEDAAAALLWLAMNFPAVCDAMLDKVEYDAIDDDPDPCREPEPLGDDEPGLHDLGHLIRAPRRQRDGVHHVIAEPGECLVRLSGLCVGVPGLEDAPECRPRLVIVPSAVECA